MTIIDARSVPRFLLTAGTVFAAQTALAGGWQGVGEFEDATIRVEHNATDGDTEIVLTAKPLSDHGLVRLTVLSPHWRKIVEVEAPHRSGGLREFMFESPEPAGSAILPHYPEGDYLYFGTATTGQRFIGSATLSHELPGEVSIVSPVEESVIEPGALMIIWTAVPYAAHYIVEFENESVDPEQSFSFVVRPETTSFAVPSAIVVPNSDYQVGIASVHENGNVVFVETTFSTTD